MSKEAHNYLSEKGIKSISQMKTAFEIEQYLDEYAQQCCQERDKEIGKLSFESNEKDRTIAELRELLEQYVWEQEEIFNQNKAAADWHNNNVPGVGQTVEYMSYPALPKMVEEAKSLLLKLK